MVTVYERPIVRGSDSHATDEEKRTAEILVGELDGITSSFMIRRTGEGLLGSLLPPRLELLVFCGLSDHQTNLYTSFISTSCNLFSDLSGDALGVIMQLRLLCSHPNLVSKNDDIDNSDGEIALSGKMSVLRDLLQSIRLYSPLDKVVIVSNFTSVLSFIEKNIFAKNSWSFLRLDGQVEITKRQSIVDSFNRGDVVSSFAFLLSAKAGGCGLNLTGGKR